MVSMTSSYESESSNIFTQTQKKNGNERKDGSNSIMKSNMTKKISGPKSSEIDLAFEDVRYKIKTWSLKRMKIETIEILHGVSGYFKAGELSAIMGPSGAGKSTLLNVLAGYTEQGVTGKIYVNGRIRSPNSEKWKRVSCYIQQYSLLRSRITVGEAMTLAAHLKLGSSVSSTCRSAQALNLLEALNLNDSYNTLCGNLSGGQKKRLDVALELLSNPSVLFLDEPTTGLDSASCSQCISLLQRIAKNEQRTIVCTVHQPSALQFEMFDSLYTVSEGYCIYRGPVSNVVSYLLNIGLHCPPYHNPADFLLEVAVGEYGISIQKLKSAIENSQPKKMLSPRDNLNLAIDMEERKSNSGPLIQCYLLYKRHLLSLKRDYALLIVRLFCHFAIGVIFGYLYMGSGYRANSVFANYVYLYGSLLLIVYTGKMAVTLAFPLEMQILTREHFNQWYKLVPYYVSLLLVEIPFQAACASIYLIVSYGLTGQPLETYRFFSFMVVSVATSLTAQAWGFFIGATTPVKIAVFAGPIIAVLFSVFGFCIRYGDTPVGFRWLFHISYFRASFHSLLLTVYGYNRKDLYCDDKELLAYCHYRKPAKFLNEMEIVDTDIVNNIMLIVALGIIMHLLTASALWCKLNRR